jgi:AcrR family transcriptional regulator
MCADHTVPRRAKHTHEELRELILKAATELVEERGLEGLSAREIARQINYSPGTLYNVFKDRDEILFTIEARLLNSLEAHLNTVQLTGTAREQVIALANAYLEFTHANPNLWNLLFEHQPTKGKTAPDWYAEKTQALMQRIEAVISPLMQDRSKAEHERSARVLWASVHGITSLSTANRLSNVTTDTAQVMVENLVAGYLDGLEAKSPGRDRTA